MTDSIGYYVHHHGDGHRQRALLIARQMPSRIVLIGTGLAGRCEGLRYLDIPDDRISATSSFDGDDQGQPRAYALHYAPLYHDGIRARVALIAQWIARAQPALMVIDVSVEIAMLARLAATPTVYVRLGGTRTDTAHLEAFRGARALLSPFHPDLDEPATPTWVREKTKFCPGLTVSVPSSRPRADTVLVVYGNGGVGGCGETLAAAALTNPDLTWRAIGPVSLPNHLPANLTILGWVDNAAAEIAHAGVVVGGAGDGVVNSVIASGRPFVCLPESRPYGEQVAKARALKRLGAAVVLAGWPTPEAWRKILAEARAQSSQAKSRLHDPHGVCAAAAFLNDVSRSSRRVSGRKLEHCL